MSKVLDDLASGLPVGERTLRRWIHAGLIRGRLDNRHRLRLSAREREYVRRHGALLGELRRRLRTERNVRLAVLFGSMALGEGRPDSDVDLVVSLREGGALERSMIATRLERAVARKVQLVPLDAAEASPSLLADIVEEGRVVLDRDDLWPALTARRGAILRAARREEARIARRAQDAVSYLSAS